MLNSTILQEVKEQKKVSEWGTFRESLKAPVHGWFTYPAGFSFKAVEHSIRQENLVQGESVIYDPFMGSGTTNLVAKTLGYNSIGVEAHPFVFPITKAKMFWEVNIEEVLASIEKIRKNVFFAKCPANIEEYLKRVFPELVVKCFLPETLFELLIIRNSIPELDCSAEAKLFLNVSLICVLRDVSIAATGWPYISPKNIKITSISKKGASTYFRKSLKMLEDLMIIKLSAAPIKTSHNIMLGDCRNTAEIEDNSVDHIFTSPPYLNNFDYADRTRLEMYFMGAANNWGEISEKIRTKLITSATTQISRLDEKYNFLSDFINDCPNIHNSLKGIVEELAMLRLVKGGKKSYDLLTVGYFNDLYKTLKESYRVLKYGKKALYILGDSAPYGIHIPTDMFIGEIAKCVGFSDYKINVLRLRGQKWAKNPQRHSVGLRESIVTLYK
jgi:DNA modification methylase